MKYIIFQQNSYLIHPVIFGDHTSHAQVKLEGCIPISAGFVTFDKLGFSTCYGESRSLNLKADENDHIYIDRMMSNFGSYGFTPLEQT